MGWGHGAQPAAWDGQLCGVCPFLDKRVISCQLGPHRLASKITLLSLSPNEKPGSER